MGVKAYCPNNGWVDRDICKATFFVNQKEPGCYWYGLCNPGDKIFIGDIRRGGRFAIVTDVDIDYYSVTYTYKPLVETLNGEDYNGEERLYLTPLTYKPTLLEKLFNPTPNLISDICQNLD